MQIVRKYSKTQKPSQISIITAKLESEGRHTYHTLEHNERHVHELAIADAIVRAVRDEHRGKVIGIGLRIGQLTDLVDESLRFGFEALVSGTELQGCELIIEHIPAGGICGKCGAEVVVHEFDFHCPACESGDLDLTHGQELEIAYLRVRTEQEQGST